jgi:hypothetical protein
VGVVDHVFVALHEQVLEGDPVVFLHTPRVQRGTKGPEPPYDAIVFVPADERAMLQVGQPVQVFPVTIRRESDAFIHGRVVSIDELPATKLTLEESLGRPDIADTLFNRYVEKGLLGVKVKLSEAVTSMNRNGVPPAFRWSRPIDAGQSPKTGTMCQAEIVTERRRLIRLIAPWGWNLLGVN